jgi:hypothetical protein
MPNIISNKVAIEKSDPLKGFPLIHAIRATDRRGRHNNNHRTLFGGSHFSNNAAIKT